MIEIQGLSLLRGGRILLADTSLRIHPGQRVGVIGANGCGKSSLFALLLGQLSADAGNVSLPSNWRIASVSQEIRATDRSVMDHVLDGDAELREVEAQLRQAEADDDGHRIGELHGRIEAIDGYSARHRAERLLHGLGFSTGQESQPLGSFSGGWRMRAHLARALMARSDLLLLDEPTNHLDLDASLWLEDWLRSYPGTLLLISHDRDFLEGTVDHILHLEQQRATLYRGGYEQFERQRSERLARQADLARRQQREIDHMQSFVDRFRAKATKAKQAQSRLKALARMQPIAAAQVDSPFHFAFREPPPCGAPLLQLQDARLGYGEVTILSEVRLDLPPGGRLGLLGRNGAGKSTLMKALAGELPLLAGSRVPAKDLRIGYFTQHQVEQLDLKADALLHLRRQDPRIREQELRDFLGGFGFRGDDVLRPVEGFSGGERARLALALLVWQRPQLLLLDEPTNHLDLRMRDALTLALQEFAGAVVLVSHDRHLLRTTCEEWRLVTKGQVADFDGDLEDYRRWMLAGETAPPAPTEVAPSREERRERRRLEAARRERLRPLKKEIQAAEKTLARAEQRLADLETQLSDKTLYAEPHKERLRELLQEQGKWTQARNAEEERWMALSEELEGAEDA